MGAQDLIWGPPPQTWGQAIVSGVAGLLIDGILVGTVLWYFVCRVTARDLVPPDAVASNVPGWRPHIRQWGRVSDNEQVSEGAGS